MARAYVGLGANLGHPKQQLLAALAALDALAHTRVRQRSSLYRSAPVGYANQPDFINAVAELETALAPRALLDALLGIEAALGRERSFANAPRTLDLDLLLYDRLQLHEPGLAIPHPRMHLRAFVLAPLAQIAPDLCLPGHGAIETLLAGCGDQQVTVLEE